MKFLVALVAAPLLTGCFTYRITPQEKPLRAARDAQLQIVKRNQRPEGFQCLHPMFYVFSFGIIPIYCVDTYNVSLITTLEPASEATYTVSTIGGWAALVISPFPGWHFGKPENVEAKIEDAVRSQRN